METATVSWMPSAHQVRSCGNEPAVARVARHTRWSWPAPPDSPQASGLQVPARWSAQHAFRLLEVPWLGPRQTVGRAPRQWRGEWQAWSSLGRPRDAAHKPRQASRIRYVPYLSGIPIATCARYPRRTEAASTPGQLTPSGAPVESPFRGSPSPPSGQDDGRSNAKRRGHYAPRRTAR